ncbi:unnamed protein product [Linum trigynum]|uniref:Uncharacterized protein n=1 Tax=Linum trigynum TaxID=586398 RepID=A0AAV2CFM0_9ROSI
MPLTMVSIVNNDLSSMATMEESGHRQALGAGQSLRGGPAAVMESAATVNYGVGVVHRNQVTDSVRKGCRLRPGISNSKGSPQSLATTPPLPSAPNAGCPN